MDFLCRSSFPVPLGLIASFQIFRERERDSTFVLIMRSSNYFSCGRILLCEVPILDDGDDDDDIRSGREALEANFAKLRSLLRVFSYGNIFSLRS